MNVHNLLKGNLNFIDGKIYQFLDGKLEYQNIGLKADRLNIIDLSQNSLIDNDRLNIHKIFEFEEPTLILHPEPYFQAPKNVKYFPYFYYFGMKNWPPNNIYYPKTKQISCLNGNPHVHRWFMYVELKEKNYNDMILTFHKNDNYDLDYSILGNKYALLMQDYLLQNSFDEYTTNDLGINNDAYKRTMLNVVTETVVDNTIFVSEKTWKPIASGQFFVIAGCKGTVQFLRDMGVDVFDDIIDHGYDEIDDWKVRLQYVIDSIDKLLNQNLNDIFLDTLERRKSNIDKFFGGNFGGKYLDEVQNYIDTHS